jgi:fructose-bisphosphate aldolase, class I
MNTSNLKEQQQRKFKTQPGFFAALDQSGGSTPKALRNYGIKEGAWSNDKEMFALVGSLSLFGGGVNAKSGYGH